MKKITIICISFVLLFSIVVYISFSGRFEDDGKREPISVEQIDWKKLEDNQNYYGIERVVFNLDGQEKYITDLEDFLKIVQFLESNKTKLNTRKTDNAIKVHIDFYNKTLFDASREKYIYNDKKCTFYLEPSLESELKKLFLTL